MTGEASPDDRDVSGPILARRCSLHSTDKLLFNMETAPPGRLEESPYRRETLWTYRADRESREKERVAHGHRHSCFLQRASQ